jgi:glutamate racemase
MSPRPTILVFDSGLGGLTVLREVVAARGDAHFIYVADDAFFPYGHHSEDAIIARVVPLIGELIGQHAPDLVVIACNTASTLVLPALRSRFSIPFVGTVPAIKPAVALTKTGRVAILATPGTVKRDYTRQLIQSFANGIEVELVGATGLAALCEAHLKGYPVADEAILEEIGPCFVDRDGRRTDVVVLACTHYPLLLEAMRRLAPWPVTWLDPAPAIARRAADLAGPIPPKTIVADATAVFTSGTGITDDLRQALAARGLSTLAIEAMPPHWH